jgi:alpha-D-xyloside xylohydrolase
VTDLRDEYMFGPAFLVAPVTEQGATSRQVYLPAGTSIGTTSGPTSGVKGGQTITVQAPIDTHAAVRSRRIHRSAWEGRREHA